VAVVIGDVSGKGIEAAATTAMVKYALRSFIYKNPSPSFVLTQANNVVSIQLKLGSFVSLCYALYDPKTGKLDFANAGHPYPIKYTAKDGSCSLIETNNPVFGLIQNFEYSQSAYELKESDILIFYTDGLIEARIGKEFFGAERALASACVNHTHSAQDIAMSLVRDCDEFAKGNLVDDVAILVLKRHENKTSPARKQINRADISKIG
jgi:sigma-B regulation protein RsbU (phosphoserine phosphatase)